MWSGSNGWPSCSGRDEPPADLPITSRGLRCPNSGAPSAPPGAPYPFWSEAVRYMLQVAPDAVDAAEFPGPGGGSQSAAPEQAETQLTSALGMWRGPRTGRLRRRAFRVRRRRRFEASCAFSRERSGSKRSWRWGGTGG